MARYGSLWEDLGRCHRSLTAGEGSIMRKMTAWRRSAALVCAVAMIAVACGGGDDDADEPDATEEPAEDGGDDADDAADDGGDDADDDGGDAAPTEIETGVGVTEEPCPEGVNPDNGCIYLGHISDLTEGPFFPLAVEILAAQENFFARVNEDGGIAGYDVSLVTRDNKYNPQEHVTVYEEIADDVLSLGMSLGTPPTLAALDLMEEDQMLAVPASWWSGWDHEESDRGLVVASGYSYCIESMIGLDWYAGEFGDPESVLAVGYPGDYGGDSAAGAAAWAEANGAEFLGFTQTAPNAIAGNQDAVVSAIMQAQPDVVTLGIGPLETGEIVAKAAASGYEGFFMGAVPTWNPALMGDEGVAAAMTALYRHISYSEVWNGDSPGHEAMRASLDGELPSNDAYVLGWFQTYPMLALLEAAAANGDLTRAGLVEALDGLVVDYEGGMPTKTYTGDGAVDAQRTGVINTPDPEAELGLSAVVTDFQSPTADAFDYTSACAAAS